MELEHKPDREIDVHTAPVTHIREPDQDIDVQTAPVIHTHTRICDTLENANIKQEAELQSNGDTVEYNEYVKSSGTDTHMIDIKTEVIGSDSYHSGNMNIMHGPVHSDGDIVDQIAPTNMTAIKPEPGDETNVSNEFVIEIDTCKDEYYEKYGYPTNYSNVTLQNSEICCGHTSYYASGTQPCIVSEIHTTYPHITTQPSVRVHDIGPNHVISGPPETTASKLPRHGKSSKDNETHDVCLVCGVAFSSKSALNMHTLTHTEVKPYKCSVCGVGFKQKGNRKKHIRIHTGEKPHKCPVCKVGFTHKAHLTRHMRIHTGEKPYKCSVCGAGFAQKGDVKKHMRIHTGERPHKCLVCEVSFSQKSGLTYHMRTHTGEKPHKCSVCEVSFTRKGTLTDHMRTHTGEKPFKCTICGVDFSQRYLLMSHTRIHTGEKPYTCQVCGDGFRQKSDLTKHARIHIR